jgi:hypothetical protein
MTRTEKLKIAAEADSTVVVNRKDAETTFGNNPDYLLDIHGITKSDLIRWERQGLAFKARYETRHPKQDLLDKLNEKRAELEKSSGSPLPPIVGKTGVHRVRWVIYKEALDA